MSVLEGFSRNAPRSLKDGGAIRVLYGPIFNEFEEILDHKKMCFNL